MGKAVMEKVR